MTNLGQQSDPRSLDAANKAQGQRTRKRAAIFMIAASLSAGFILGRASAWLLPWGVDGQQSKVNATAGRQRNAQDAPAPSDQASLAVSRALSPGADASTERRATPNVASAETPTRAADVLLWASRSTLMSQPTEIARPVVTVLNPGNANADTGSANEEAGVQRRRRRPR
jgi:hypothetical protein